MGQQPASRPQVARRPPRPPQTGVRGRHRQRPARPPVPTARAGLRARARRPPARPGSRPAADAAPPQWPAQTGARAPLSFARPVLVLTFAGRPAGQPANRPTGRPADQPGRLLSARPWRRYSRRPTGGGGAKPGNRRTCSQSRPARPSARAGRNRWAGRRAHLLRLNPMGRVGVGAGWPAEGQSGWGRRSNRCSNRRCNRRSQRGWSGA